MALLGQALVLAGLLFATVGSILGFAAGWKKSAEAQLWARRCAYAFAATMIAANAVMITALLTHDFSVSYVAHVGSRSTPVWVTIVSLWSSLEGSILFWGFVLGVYIAAASWHLSGKYPEHEAYSTAVMLACGMFFSFLIAGPANPFKVVASPPMDGPGPNALLQNHILMVVHPPTLYAGYVGMVVPFSLACSALLSGRLGNDFLKPLRLWLMIPWTFLTIGMVLGGWWAYEVLGWGGYWAWDPVENASFLPWLTATAAVHSALVTERRGVLKGWTAALVMSTFLLTILGTFMTRSGVFNSVHSFTQSDIGPTFLAFLAVLLVASVLLLAFRMGALEADGRIPGTFSREAMVLGNNLVFVLLTFAVLLGTVFPLVVEAVEGRQISVGEPYFNRFSVPLGISILFLMGIGPALPWGRATPAEALRRLAPPLLSGVVLAGGAFAFGVRGVGLLATFLCAGYALHVTIGEALLPVRQQMSGGKKSFGEALANLLGPGRRRLGAYIVHTGVAVSIIAIGVSSAYKLTTEATLRIGQSTSIGAYELTFTGTESVQESHRQSTIVKIAVKKDGKPSGTIEPRMNHYMRERSPIGTPAVESSLVEDLYLSVMSVDERTGVVGLRVFVNPMVAWIWIGLYIITFGAILALLPVGARKKVAAEDPAPSAPQEAPLAQAPAAARTADGSST